MIAWVDLHVDQCDHIDVDRIVAVCSHWIREEGVINNKIKREFFDLFDRLVDFLCSEVIGSEFAIFFVDKGTGEEIALIFDWLLVARDIRPCEVVEVVEIVIVGWDGTRYFGLDWYIGGDEFSIDSF